MYSPQTGAGVFLLILALLLKEYLMGGGDMASLKELMGHCDISITEEAYVCFTHRDLREKLIRHVPTLEVDE